MAYGHDPITMYPDGTFLPDINLFFRDDTTPAPASRVWYFGNPPVQFSTGEAPALESLADYLDQIVFITTGEPLAYLDVKLVVDGDPLKTKTRTMTIDVIYD